MPDFPARDGGPGLPPLPLPTPQMYRQAMDWLGIDRVVVTQANAYQHDNDCLLACLDDMGDVARGVAVISPDTTETEIEAFAAAGVIGARIMDLPGGAVGLDQIGGMSGSNSRAAMKAAAMAVRNFPILHGLPDKSLSTHQNASFGGQTGPTMVQP